MVKSSNVFWINDLERSLWQMMENESISIEHQTKREKTFHPHYLLVCSTLLDYLYGFWYLIKCYSRYLILIAGVTQSG